jgi:hypothetical protein
MLSDAYPIPSDVCDYCGERPARMLLRDSKRWLCGVCAHRLGIAKDLARRIHRAKVRARDAA